MKYHHAITLGVSDRTPFKLGLEDEASFFYVEPNRFDKRPLLGIPGCFWRGDSWGFPATRGAIEQLARAYGEMLAVDITALPKVKALLGYDPTCRNGQILLAATAYLDSVPERPGELIEKLSSALSVCLRLPPDPSFASRELEAHVRAVKDRFEELVPRIHELLASKNLRSFFLKQEIEASFREIYEGARENLDAWGLGAGYEEEVEALEFLEVGFDVLINTPREVVSPTADLQSLVEEPIEPVELQATPIGEKEEIHRLEFITTRTRDRLVESVALRVRDEIASLLREARQHLGIGGLRADGSARGAEPASDRVRTESESRSALELRIPGFRELDPYAQALAVDLERVRDMFEAHDARDWGPLINYAGRIVEIEAVRRILKPWKAAACRMQRALADHKLSEELQSRSPRSSGMSTLRFLLKTAAGARQGERVISKEDQEVLLELLRHAFPAGHATIMQEIQPRIEEFWPFDRNPASHDEVIPRDQALRGRALILGDKDESGLLAVVVKIEAGPTDRR